MGTGANDIKLSFYTKNGEGVAKKTRKKPSKTTKPSKLQKKNTGCPVHICPLCYEVSGGQLDVTEAKLFLKMAFRGL